MGVRKKMRDVGKMYFMSASNGPDSLRSRRNMLLGKRPRPPIMRRTTSMSGGMAVDMQVSNLEAHEELVSDPLHLQDIIKDPHPHAMAMGPDDGSVADQAKNVFGAKGYEYDERLLGMVMSPSPTNNHLQNQTSNSAHVIHTAHFLRTCGLCKCRLAPGRDIYMYRGDTAFCSLECRAQQMKQDQRKEKWKVASNKVDHRASPPTATATAKASTKGETIGAACT